MAELTEGELNAISIMARCCSAVSLLGCLIIIVTFSCSSAFQEKPINRLVFYASLGNLMTNIATLMSRAYVDDVDSFGCQFQGMMIQWFLAADAGWILCMAINVYLTFYRQFDAKRLRRMELMYIVTCYGITFIPAFTFLFARRNGQRIYGDATLWCWVSQDFDVLRIATFYGPVWVVILITISIYLRAGRTIFENRKQLRELRSHDSLLSENGEEGATVKRTEISVTTEAAAGSTHVENTERPDPAWAEYSIAVSADDHGPPAADGTSPVDSRALTERTRTVSLTPLQSQRSTRRSFGRRHSARRHGYEFKSAAWSYTKCALLYFTAILITWIPSSANRAYSLVHGGEAIVSLEFMSAFVLPLQGFWNCLIYTVMSWAAYKKLFKDMKGGGAAVSEMTAWMRGANLTAIRHPLHRSMP